MSDILANLPIEKKKAVIQLGYQLIVSAAGRPLSSSDDESINIVTGECMLQSGNQHLDEMFSNALWNDAIFFDPFEAFRIVSSFTQAEKEAFKHMMLKVARHDNTFLRMDILTQIFNRTQIY